MDFETNAVISVALFATAFALDWPRALAGLIFGAFSRLIPYATIFVPLGVVVIAAAGEFIYPLWGRSSEASFGSFALGLFSVAATASNLYITMRNLKDRL